MFLENLFSGFLSLFILFMFLFVMGILSKGIFNVVYHFSPSFRIWVDTHEFDD